MKKLQMTLLMLCGIVLATLPLAAETEKVGNYTWTYRINGDAAEICGLYGNYRYVPCVSPSPVGAVVIPSTLGGKPVTGIGRYAFIDCSGLTSVTISDNVTSIGDSAFYGSGLANVTIPDGVTSIGDSAFYGCHNLTRVTIPDSMTRIGNNVFDDCPYSLFDTTTIPGLTLVDGWIVGHTDFFYGDLNLTGIRGIGDSAFYGCSGLTSVTVGNDVTSIGQSAFGDCSDLTSVIIGNGVTSIGEHAFEYCRNLDTLVLQGSVTNIGDAAFLGCSGLHGVSVPNIETWLGMTFSDQASNPLHNYKDNYSCSLMVDGRAVIDLIIPKGVTRINDYAFNGYLQLKSVILSDTTASIGMYAFYRCTQLTNVIFSESSFDIGTGAFCSCTNLTSITISPDVTNIADSAFAQCPMLELNFSKDGIVHALPNPSRDYFLFKGWTTDQDELTIETGVTACTNKTYHALWEKDGVVITSFDLTIPEEITVGDEYYQLFGQGGGTLVGNIYDQSGDPIEIEGDGWYGVDIEGAFYNASHYPPAGDCTITVYYASWSGVTNVSGSASRTITINKRNLNDEYGCIYNYPSISSGNSSNSSYYEGSSCSLGSIGAIDSASIEIRDNGYSTGEYYYSGPSIIVRDRNWNELVEGYDYSIESTMENGSACLIVRFHSSGDFYVDVSTSGYHYEDDYSFYDSQGTTVYVSATVYPLPITDLTITAESKIVYTGESIRNEGTQGSELFNGLMRLNMSDWSSVYVISPVAVTNAGTYQIAVGAQGDNPPSPEDFAGVDCDCFRYIPHVVYTDEYGYEHEYDCTFINYEGLLYLPFIVHPRPVASEQARIVPQELHCDGTPQTCSLVITNDYTGAVLVDGQDYDVSYSNNVLAGMATATVTCKGNYTGTFSQEFEILPSTNVVEVLGLDKAWTTGGTAEWFAEWYDNAHDGVSCMRSGAIGDGQESWIETVVTNTGVVSFWWKASSEAYRGVAYDKLVFTVDGVIPVSVPPIGGEVGWTNVAYAVEGDGAHVLRWTYLKDASDDGGEDCAWLDDVQYLREVHVTFADGGAMGGGAPDALVVGEGAEITLPGQASLVWPKYRFVGWRIYDEPLATGTVYRLGYDDVTFTAVWEEKRVSAPSIEVAAWYDTERTTVRMGCDTAGVAIHYTLDGSTPTAESPIYAGSFSIAGTVTIKAIAVLDDWFDSDVVSAESVRAPWTLDECLNATGMVFQMGGAVEWKRDRTVTHDGDTAMQSGEIGDGQTSWIETTVVGAGTLTFWWKASSEAYKGTLYDYARFTVDDVAAVPDIGGEIDWRCETVTITGGGTHAIRWVYIKDAQDSNGSDCAWLDCVSWTAEDPLPALDAQATDGDVAAIVGGLSDVRLSEKVVGTAAYTAFRTWVDSKNLSHATVRDAPNAWLSYALGAPGLMAKATPLASEDVVIESIEPSGVTSGAFDLVVDIAGAEIGTAANLAEVFGVEGATELNESAFSSNGLTVTLQRTADGKAKATVTPAGSPSTFFMRVKVK